MAQLEGLERGSGPHRTPPKFHPHPRLVRKDEGVRKEPSLEGGWWEFRE